jgi:hypothetical protein
MTRACHRPLARALVWAALCAVAPRAGAEGLDLPAPTAAGVARAGAGMLSLDDGGALLLDPANLARRTGNRAQIGLGLVSSDATFVPAAGFPGGEPAIANDRAGVDLVPFAALELGLGRRVVVAAALLSPSDLGWSYPEPPTTWDPAADDRAAYPYRYAGERFHLRRTGGGVGVAVRALPWLAVGGAALAFDVSMWQQRTLWAGDPAAAGDLGSRSPAWDMPFFAGGEDGFVPALSAGLVVAPVDLPLELGASVFWSADAHLVGSPTLGPTRDPSLAGAAVDPEASASLDLPMPIYVRAGARVLFRRAALELDGELVLGGGGASAPAWSLAGVTVTPQIGPPVPLAAVPLGPMFSDSFAVRAALDIDVVPGVLTVTAGYAFASRAVAAASTSPVFPADDTHTFALGVHARVAGGSVTLGVARSQRFAADHAAEDVQVVDPLGPLAVPVPAAAGRYASGDTMAALQVELDLP